MITFTVDVEDPSGHYEPDGRYVHMTKHVLEFCRTLKIRGTFFVVGKIAQSNPALIRLIKKDGHEIAYHSHAHVPLNHEDPVRFRRETEVDKKRIEDLVQEQLVGYRAPMFSLTPKTRWVLSSLKELGFHYSSSIIPSKLGRFSYANTPKTPFRWSEGIIELPLPVHRFLFTDIPYLGGFYLYVMPQFAARHFIDEADSGSCLWTYTHPYDFDQESPYHRLESTSHLTSLLLYGVRPRVQPQLRWVLARDAGPPLKNCVAQFSSLYIYS